MGIEDKFNEWNDFIEVATPSSGKIIPNEEHAAPKYKMMDGKKENHNKGYHSHIVRTRGNKRTDIMVTRDENFIYVTGSHGSGIHTTLDEGANYVKRHIKDVIKALGNIGIGHYTKPVKNKSIAIPLGKYR